MGNALKKNHFNIELRNFKNCSLKTFITVIYHGFQNLFCQKISLNSFIFLISKDKYEIQMNKKLTESITVYGIRIIQK